MAEDTIDAVQREMGGPVTPCVTKQYPLAGAKGFDRDFAERIEQEYALPADVAKHLAGKFGSRSLQVLELIKENPSWKERIAPQLPAIQAELVYCIRYELAETVEDLLARRTAKCTMNMPCMLRRLWVRCWHGKRAGILRARRQRFLNIQQKYGDS
jgi:glycerol-3-phosphate dehydrogenase